MSERASTTLPSQRARPLPSWRDEGEPMDGATSNHAVKTTHSKRLREIGATVVEAELLYKVVEVITDLPVISLNAPPHTGENPRVARWRPWMALAAAVAP